MERNRVILILTIFVIDLFCIFANDKKEEKIPFNFRLQDPPVIIPEEEIILLVGEEYNIDIPNVKWSASGNAVAVEKGHIKAILPGTVTVYASNNDFSDSVKVLVTDLITKPGLNNEKEYIKCNQYSKEDEETLEYLLNNDINSAGYETRAGVVAAARFLTLKFKNRIAYFYENGRLLTNGQRNYVDGEGRYYHKGLYLSDNDKKDLAATLEGPAIWGCPLYSRVVKGTSANGLDCSGFVSWALYNGGFDIGDAGAGISKEKTNDLDDLGPKIKISDETLTNIEFKVGDLFSRKGHIGMLIGYDSEYFYVAEALTHDLHVLKMTKEDILKSKWTYIIDMSNVYKNDGNLTNMW